MGFELPGRWGKLNEARMDYPQAGESVCAKGFSMASEPRSVWRRHTCGVGIYGEVVMRKIGS
jgi:hypothetical protein